MAIFSDSQAAAAADKPAPPPAKTAENGVEEEPKADTQADTKADTPKADIPKDAAATAATPDDQVNPPDFAGSVRTNNTLPSTETLRRVGDLPVLDRTGQAHSFRSLYEPAALQAAGRVLIVFVRHFFCGNCQEYLRVLSREIPPAMLEAGGGADSTGSSSSSSTRGIIVIGCGEPSLIDFYAETSGCPYPIYADPTRQLYDELGMVSTLALGTKGNYMKEMSFARMVLRSMFLTLKQVPKGLVNKGGNARQVGGEFLFETTTRDGKTQTTRVTWCHRMKTTRDHAEIDELKEILGLAEKGTKEEEK